MTSDEFHEDIRARVHDRIDARAYRLEKEEEVQPCDECRQSFEAELEERMQVQERDLLAPDVPADGAEAAVRTFDALERSERRRMAIYSSRSRRSSIKFPLFFLLGITLVLAAYIVLFDDSSGPVDQAGQVDGAPAIPEPTRRSSGPVNFFNYALENYEHLFDGTLDIEYEVDNLRDARESMAADGAGKFTFAGVSMPLKGAIVSTHGTLNLPALVYGEDEMLLYIVIIGTDQLRSKEQFYVTDDVWKRLENGEAVWVDATHDGHLAMFVSGDEVIVAVGNVSTSDMGRLLRVSTAQSS
jgi:hypothetical protein